MVVRINNAYNSFGVKKKLPYTRFMNYEISKLRESGMLDLILERNAIKPPQCLEEENEDKEISLQKVIFPFSVVMIGIVFASIIVCIENCYHSFNAKQKRKLIFENDNILMNVGKRVIKIPDTVVLMPATSFKKFSENC